jgi:hypothetical protein
MKYPLKLFMVKLQLLLFQATTLSSKHKEATSMDKVDFSIVGLGSLQKGDSRRSTSCEIS